MSIKEKIEKMPKKVSEYLKDERNLEILGIIVDIAGIVVNVLILAFSIWTMMSS
ncbi:MAG: hypothetical protein HONDAALG_00456 [Gammaproteobacteria bacterium]|nr:hypothetical protein [Gammaproteobacteria bacterium]